MSGYVPYPLDVDAQRIIASMLADWIGRGYAGDETDPGTALVETVGYRNAETRQVLVDFAAAAYGNHGVKIYGIPPIAAAPATVLSTWVAGDSLGHTIPAGTHVAFALTGDDRVAFKVLAETVIDPGQTTATDVELAAVIPGTAANGIPAATELLLMDSLAWVSSVTATTDSAGGVDAETPLEHLDRLVTDIRFSSTGGLVLPADYANAARQVVGVARAIVIAGYDPTVPSTGNERMVTAFVVDEAGAAVPAGVKDDVEAALAAKRETNFVVHVADPDVNPIAVVYTATAEPGTDSTLVQDAADQAVLDHLDPADWGTRTLGHEWEPDDTVRYFKLVEIIESTPGVLSLDTLTVNGGTTDVVMTGVAPLPDASVDGTVT